MVSIEVAEIEIQGECLFISSLPGKALRDPFSRRIAKSTFEMTIFQL